VDRRGEGRWVGSAGHEEVLKLTDLKEVFEDEVKDEDADKAGGGEDTDEVGRDSGGDGENQELEDLSRPTEPEAKADCSGEEDGDSDVPKEKKRKRKQDKDVLAGRKKKGRNQVDAEPSFFSGL
jgi:WD repeat-containing protein 55